MDRKSLVFIIIYLFLILGGGALITYGIVHNELSRFEEVAPEVTPVPTVAPTQEPTVTVTPAVKKPVYTMPSATKSATVK